MPSCLCLPHLPPVSPLLLPPSSSLLLSSFCPSSLLSPASCLLPPVSCHLSLTCHLPPCPLDMAEEAATPGGLNEQSWRQLKTTQHFQLHKQSMQAILDRLQGKK